MMEFDSVSACQQLIAALDEGHDDVIKTLNHPVDPAIKIIFQKRFRLIILLAITTAALLGALTIFQLFDHEFDDEIKYTSAGGSALLLLLGLLGYLTIRKINDKLIGLDKRQSSAIKAHGFQATQLAKLLDTESTQNTTYNTLTKRVLTESGNTLSHYSNTPDALKAMSRIASAAKHAQCLISNPSITPSDSDFTLLANTLAETFKATHQAKAEWQWKQLVFFTLYLCSASFLIGIPTGLSIASSYLDNTGKMVSLGFSVLSAFIGIGINHVNSRLNDDIPSLLKANYVQHIQEMIGSLLKHFPEDDLDNIDRALVSIIIDELALFSRGTRSLPDMIQGSKNVQAALEQALVFAKAKFTLFKMPENDAIQPTEQQPLLKSAQLV